MFAIYVTLTMGQRLAFKKLLSGARGDEKIAITSKFLSSQIKCIRLFYCFHEAGDETMCALIEEAAAVDNKKLTYNVYHSSSFLVLAGSNGCGSTLYSRSCMVLELVSALAVNKSLASNTMDVWQSHSCSGEGVLTILKALGDNNSLQWLSVPWYHPTTREMIKSIVQDINASRKCQGLQEKLTVNYGL